LNVIVADDLYYNIEGVKIELKEYPNLTIYEAIDGKELIEIFKQL